MLIMNMVLLKITIKYGVPLLIDGLDWADWNTEVFRYFKNIVFHKILEDF